MVIVVLGFVTPICRHFRHKLPRMAKNDSTNNDSFIWRSLPLGYFQPLPLAHVPLLSFLFRRSQRCTQVRLLHFQTRRQSALVIPSESVTDLRMPGSKSSIRSRNSVIFAAPNAAPVPRSRMDAPVRETIVPPRRARKAALPADSGRSSPRRRSRNVAVRARDTSSGARFEVLLVAFDACIS